MKELLDFSAAGTLIHTASRYHLPTASFLAIIIHSMHSCSQAAISTNAHLQGHQRSEAKVSGHERGTRSLQEMPCFPKVASKSLLCQWTTVDAYALSHFNKMRRSSIERRY